MVMGPPSQPLRHKSTGPAPRELFTIIPGDANEFVLIAPPEELPAAPVAEEPPTASTPAEQMHLFPTIIYAIPYEGKEHPDRYDATSRDDPYDRKAG